MSNQCGLYPPELKAALGRLMESASGRAGKRMACKVMQREAELWPQVQRMLAEARENPRNTREFDALWETIAPEVRVTIRSAGRYRDDDDVREAEQLTAIEVFRKRLNYSIEKGPFLVWVRGIARNISRWRRADKAANPTRVAGSIAAAQEKLLPPSRCYEELLRWVQERATHQAITFLLHAYLGWSLPDIETDLGSRTMPELASLVVNEIRESVPGLEDPDELFEELKGKAQAMAQDRLMAFYGNESANQALSHWSGGVARWLRGRVVGGGKALLKCISALRAGAHERLTFLWSRFLRRTLESLYAHADKPLWEILNAFRRDFPRMSDLTAEQVERCTEPLAADILPRTLAECSKKGLAEDLVVWRARIQDLAAEMCLEGSVTYAYLCGALGTVAKAAKGATA